MRGAHKYCTFSLLRKNVRKYQNTSSDNCNTYTNNIYIIIYSKKSKVEKQDVTLTLKYSALTNLL